MIAAQPGNIRAFSPAHVSWSRSFAAAVVVALVGLGLVLVALTGGRRARHTLSTSRSITLVDDNVIASGLARRAAAAAGVRTDNVRATVARRRIDLHVIPVSGISIDRGGVLATAADELDSYQLQPAMRSPRLRVASQGEVGA